MRATVVSSGPRRRLEFVGFALFAVVLLGGAVWFLVAPPAVAMWGNSTLVPRLFAVATAPGVLYSFMWFLYTAFRPDPLLVIDDVGLMTRTQPPRKRVATWERVSSVRRSENGRSVVVYRVGDRPIKVFTEMLEPGWDADRVLAEIRRRWKPAPTT